MQDSLKSLNYAIRPKAIAKYLCMIALMLAFLACIPLLVSIQFGEYSFSKRYAVIIILLIIAGVPGIKLPHPTDIQYNESLTITALAFILTPLVMSYPIMGAGLNFIDAWFEAVSAITTTGLSTVTHISAMPATFRFARAWMQWYGGLGIVVLSVAILMKHHIALRRLINPSGENMITTTRIYARRVLVVYMVLTLGGFFLLSLLLHDPFNALTHTMSAVSTGGFSSFDDSLAGLPWRAQIGISLLSLSGAIPFILYYRLTRESWRGVLSDIEIRALLSMTLVICLLLTLSLITLSGMNWLQAAQHALLLGISAQSTTGFSSLELNTLPHISLGLLIISMIIGGGAGSTAGGFKILRLLILTRLIRLSIQRTALPAHAISELQLDDKAMENDEIERALVLIILFMIAILISWIIFLAYGYEPLRALFEVTSAVGTVGLSCGVTSHNLEPLLKFVLCIDMTLGRLEIIAFLVVLYPGTWFGKRME